ncbi:CpsD/CapB family tyrosine-protein kinase [Novosphingobium sp.]|uniref:CpsD/CapB family tyrosine-protein kinase n=1 Tax=Novosphingobium sp. TaxID=1874826 RepID=UPI003B525586
MTNFDTSGPTDPALSALRGRILALEDTQASLEQSDDAKQGLFGFNSRDRRSRPFNLLRSQVMKLVKANRWKVIGITSATPRVGKSFTACNLAASLGRIPNLRTLLFDLDLRRGSIAETFSLPVGPGINSFLAEEIDSVSALAYNVAGTGLTIYPCFPTDAPSAELLAGSRLRALISAMRNLPDDVICICDLPPAFANDDAAIVLSELDAYLFVVEEGVTTARQVRDSIDLLKPSLCMGTIFNRYHGGIGGDDYGFGYGTSRDYDAYYS